MTNEPQFVPIHTTIPVWQKTMLDQFAKEEGFMTLAEALRRALTEWRNFKAAEKGIKLVEQEEQ